MTSSSIETTERLVRVIADTVLANENYFCELDGVVGDGDFGYSLARGFEKILEDWDNIDRSSPGNFLKRVGMIIPSRVGGVSGTIWGTAFMRLVGYMVSGFVLYIGFLMIAFNPEKKGLHDMIAKTRVLKVR